MSKGQNCRYCLAEVHDKWKHFEGLKLVQKQVSTFPAYVRQKRMRTTGSAGSGIAPTVDIDVTFVELLRAWRKSSTSEFVIESPVRPRPKAISYHHYRTNYITRKLLAWLRAHGVDAQNALHTLRKEFGTQINRTYGIFAASAALRHTSIQLTQAIYVAKKDRTVFPLPNSQTAANDLVLAV